MMCRVVSLVLVVVVVVVVVMVLVVLKEEEEEEEEVVLVVMVLVVSAELAPMQKAARFSERLRSQNRPTDCRPQRCVPCAIEGSQASTHFVSTSPSHTVR